MNALRDVAYGNGRIVGVGDVELQSNNSLVLSVGQPSVAPGFGNQNRIGKDNRAVPNSQTAWVAFGVAVTNPVNFVQFNAGFIGTNAAQGLLTAFWNTTHLGMVDQRHVRSNNETFRLPLVSTVTNGLYTLSLRLDAFGDGAMSIVITDIAVGFVGAPESIRMTASFSTNGLFKVQLMEVSKYSYILESSVDLIDWIPIALLPSTNGLAAFEFELPPHPHGRFYRTLLSF